MTISNQFLSGFEMQYYERNPEIEQGIHQVLSVIP